MKTDIVSKRIFVVAISLTMVLFSASLFIFSLSTVNRAYSKSDVSLPATSNERKQVWDDQLRGGVGLGIHEGIGYFVVFAKPNMLYKVDLKKARDWYEE